MPTPLPLSGPPRWWSLLAGLALLGTAVATPAIAGIFGKRSSEPPTVTPEPEPEPAPALPDVASTPLWTGSLPANLGPLPEGLANVSAQGCAACHGDLVDSWSGSAHGARPSERLLQAAADASDPRCLSCHLPLDVQHRQVSVLDGGDPRTPVTGLNADFEATLSAEGVTCAACHVRDGQVLGARATAPGGAHGSSYSEQLSDARACATCHQLSWPGADRPLYDTVGEWERSAYPQAGIDCATCHLDSSAGHAMSLPASRAVSLLIELPPAALVRGGEEVLGSVVLQNTGAGHAFPTGSPWKGVRLTVALEGPAPKGAGRQTWGEPVVVDLARTLSDTPPWTTLSDTRLQAGEQRRIPLPVAVPMDAPRGTWEIVARLSDTDSATPDSQPAPQPIVEQRIRLAVE